MLRRADQLPELDLLYRTAPVGLALLDCDLRYVRVNDRLAAANGPSPEQHVGRLPREILGELGQTLEGICRRVLETGEPVIGLAVHGATPAHPGVEKDWLVNFHRLADTQGSVLGISAVVEEITPLKDAERALQQAHDELEMRVRQRTAELLDVNNALRTEIADREHAEESLRRSEERYRLLVENLNDVIFTVDAEGRITYISPAIERVAGRAPSEVLGRSFLDFIYPDDAPALVDSFRRVLDGELEPSEYRIFGKDGRVHWLRSQSRPVLKDGCVVAVQGVLTDVTPRRHAETEARRHREELAHVQRLATAGEMAAEIAHQINQPLAAIVNFAGGLAARLRNGQVQHEAMCEVADRIADEARRAGDVIRSLRAFLRKGESALRDSDLNSLVTRVHELLRDDFEREEIELRLTLDSRLPKLSVDPVLIEQVVLNLLRNAFEATAGRHGGARCVQVATAVDAASAYVTVKDTGVGLPVGREANVFDPFFTTKPDGLGLGLSISRSIIEASGGRLWAERDRGGGSTVGFALPLAWRGG